MRSGRSTPERPRCPASPPRSAPQESPGERLLMLRAGRSAKASLEPTYARDVTNSIVRPSSSEGGQTHQRGRIAEAGGLDGDDRPRQDSFAYGLANRVEEGLAQGRGDAAAESEGAGIPGGDERRCRKADR